MHRRVLLVSRLAAFLFAPALFAQIDFRASGTRYSTRISPSASRPRARRLPRPAHQRRRAPARRELRRRHPHAPRAPVQAAPRRLQPARPRESASVEGSRHHDAADRRLAHAHLLAGSRADHLDGWTPASSRVGAAHLAGILDRRVERRDSHGDHHAPQSRLDPPQRRGAQRPLDAHRALDPSRRPVDADQHRPRSRVPDRAVHPLDRLRSRPAPAHRPVSLRSGGRGRARRRKGAALSARQEHVPGRVSRAPLHPRAGRARRLGDDAAPNIARIPRHPPPRRAPRSPQPILSRSLRSRCRARCP